VTFAARTLGNLVQFVPVNHQYTTGTGATETVPAGAQNVVIEAWGAGGDGGTGNGAGCSSQNGGGGGGGGYSRTSIAVNSGQTITYTVGQPVNGAAGGDTTVSSGTLAITTMTAHGGAVANNYNGSGTAAGGTASGGTAANTTGNVGQDPSVGSSGGAARAGIEAADASGAGKGGNGGNNGAQLGHTNGANGLVNFFYT
jgi:hypothetical protein